MSKVTCPTCQHEIGEKAKFCGKCGSIIRCSNLICNAVLGAGVDFCEECGHPVDAASMRAPINTFSHDIIRQGKNHEQHTQIAMTNEAVREMAPFIVDRIFPGQPYPSLPSVRRNGSAATREQKALMGDLFQNEQPVIDVPASESELQQRQHQENGAARFFEKSGDCLVPRKRDFKGNNWADQSRHFLVLYIAAYNTIFGKPVPDKNHFKSAADKAEIYDPGNFSKYVNQQVSAFTMNVDGGYKLNDDGEKEVVRIIALMDNPSSESGFDYWKKEPGNGTERHRLSNKDKERLANWAAESVDLGKLEVRDVKSSLHYALLAYWILTTKLNKTEAIHRYDAHYYLRKKFTIVDVSSQAFGRAVVDDTEKRFFRESGDNHFLSSEAIAIVEGWIEGNPIEIANPHRKEPKQ